jgi:hypothetical protein
MKKMRLALFIYISSFGMAFADTPTSGGDGSVKCNPGCTTLECSGGICKACNSNGCVYFKDIVK